MKLPQVTYTYQMYLPIYTKPAGFVYSLCEKEKAMEPCVKCGAPGHVHHIVFRSHGGLNNELNLVNLCPMHHELGPDAPHRSRQADLELKQELQEQYFELFNEEEYTLARIAELIGISNKKCFEAFLKVKNFAGIYQKEDVIRRLMGGRLY